MKRRYRFSSPTDCALVGFLWCRYTAPEAGSSHALGPPECVEPDEIAAGVEVTSLVANFVENMVRPMPLGFFETSMTTIIRLRGGEAFAVDIEGAAVTDLFALSARVVADGFGGPGDQGFVPPSEICGELVRSWSRRAHWLQ